MTAIASKNVLITGGASGIGRLMGLNALERGAAKLIVWDIDKDKMNALAAEVEDSNRIHCMQVDVSSTDEIRQAADQLKKSATNVDILINNAGIVVGTEFWKHDHDDIDRTLQINSNALMHIALCFLPDMIERQSGHIVNIASAAGMLANPKMSVYVASKWAVIGWSESLRIELEKNHPQIKVTTVTPSYISTGMFDGVKTHWISPVVKPEQAAQKVIRGIERNKVYVRMPWSVFLIPILKGLLPAKWFDVVAGKWLKVYQSMDEFKGHGGDE